MSAGFLIPLLIVQILFLLGFLRLGGRVIYSEEGVRVQVRVGAFHVTVFPRGKKKDEEPETDKEDEEERPVDKVWNKIEAGINKAEELLNKKKKPKNPKSSDKPKNPKKKGKKKPGKPKITKGGLVKTALKLLPDIFAILGDTVHKLRVDEVYLRYTIPGRKDAAGAAKQYGIIYATGGVVWEVLDKFLTIKSARVDADVDFTSEEARVYILAELSFTIGQIVAIGVHGLIFGWKFYQMAKKQSAK